MNPFTLEETKNFSEVQTFRKCNRCKNPADEGYLSCSKCRAYQGKRFKNKTCQTCGQPCSKELCRKCKDDTKGGRRKRQRNGLCPRCGKPSAENEISCVDCLKICYECEVAPVEEGYKSCNPCRMVLQKKKLEEKNELKARRKEKELCFTCVAPLVGDDLNYNDCLSCREKRNDGKKKKIDQGFCASGCNRPSEPGKKQCLPCRQKGRDKMANRIAQGFCVCCDTPKVEGAAMCAAHLLRDKFGKTVKNKIRLGKYFWNISKEDFYKLISFDCYYCELPLEANATTGGLDRLNNENKTYELANVVTCCLHCNIAKNAFYTPKQFKEYVASGIRRFRLEHEFKNKILVPNPSKLPESYKASV